MVFESWKQETLFHVSMCFALTGYEMKDMFLSLTFYPTVRCLICSDIHPLFNLCVYCNDLYNWKKASNIDNHTLHI